MNFQFALMNCSEWKFDSIVTSHFLSPIEATPNDVRMAFAYLKSETNDALPNISYLGYN